MINRVYRCDSGDLVDCDLYNVQLPLYNSYFRIIGEGTNPADHVQRLQLFDSEVSHLSSYICTYLPQIMLLLISNHALKQSKPSQGNEVQMFRDSSPIYPDIFIEPDTFETCTRLSELYLIGLNTNGQLDENLFWYNAQLIKLGLISMNLTHINPSLFHNLRHLEILSLRNNKIANFPTAGMPKLEKLNAIFLDSNHLTSLNVKQIASKFPQLTFLSISENLFTCNALNRIFNECKRYNIKVNMESIECFAE